MVKLTFYPLGNADCCQIDFDNDRKMLVDYAHCSDAEDPHDLRIDLYKALHDDLDEDDRDNYDVVAFTHADEDHVRNASDFFHFEHAKKYQGGERIKIKELWVPASMVLEEGLKGDARVIRAEARYRLLKGKGIRIFSRPAKLEKWLEEQGIKLEDCEHLITDAGRIVPGFTTQTDGAEFFVHSPFAIRVGDELQDRNTASLVLHITFDVQGQTTRVMLGADTPHQAWTDIVNITLYHKRPERLWWDVFKLPHHCSYTALSDEKGKNKTKPVPKVKWLFEQGGDSGYIVSTSKPIPTDDSDDQPPHRQAANYYRERTSEMGGEFKVTMEHPKPSDPEPVVIVIDSDGAMLKKVITGAPLVATRRRAPRAG